MSTRPLCGQHLTNPCTGQQTGSLCIIMFGALSRKFSGYSCNITRHSAVRSC